MQVENFLKREIRYLKSGYYNKYTEGLEPRRDFNRIFAEKELSKLLDYGYSGRDLDQVMNDMGDDLYRYLKDYSNYRKILSGGKSQALVLPQKAKALDEQPQRPKFFKRLSRRH